jgi:hypothetical protein
MLTKITEGRCAICGESDQRVLKEHHHIYGRANGAEKILICFNCHRKITDCQNQLPPNARNTKSGNVDKRDFEDVSIGSLLELIGKRLKKRGLDRHGGGL